METNQDNRYALNTNKFALKLFEHESVGKEANYFISPFSIASALAMCYAGANSETGKQLKELLSLQEMSDDEIFQSIKRTNDSLEMVQQSSKVKLNVANKLYPHHKFDLKPEFSKLLREYFGSEIESLNFANGSQSAAAINQWVEAQTNEKIKNILTADSLNDTIQLILVNAIYFKAEWRYKFAKDATRKENFYLMSGDSVKSVDMMLLSGKRLAYQANVGSLPCAACRLPYVGYKQSLTIILPNEGVQLAAIEGKLDPAVLNQIMGATAQGSAAEDSVWNNCCIDVFVPRFKLEYKSEISASLCNMGASLAFDPSRADFSLMGQSDTNLFISQVLHQAVVEVNEDGTEAAAATAMMMSNECAFISVEKPIEFKCNRPFMFIIHDNTTKAILFIGKITNP